jgi:hypothetical protein
MTQVTKVAVALACVLALGCGGKKKTDDTQTTAASASAAAARGLEGTKFTKKAPAANARLEQTTNADVKFKMDVEAAGKKQSMDAESIQTEKRQETILALSGDAPTKIQVKVTEQTNVMKQGGKDQKMPAPLAGKTYIVEAKDGKTVVTTDKGKPAPKIEADQLAKSYSTLGKPDAFASALPDRPLKAGDKVDELAKAIEDEMKHTQDNASISNVSVTFREARSDDGIFDVQFTMNTTEQGMTMKMDLKGEVHIRTTDGMRTSQKFAGPVIIGGDADPKAKTKVTGSGSMELTETQHAL